jgi:hypothetical protein
VPLLEVLVELPEADPPELLVTPLLVTPLELVEELELGDEDEVPPVELEDVLGLPDEPDGSVPPLLPVAVMEFVLSEPCVGGGGLEVPP